MPGFWGAFGTGIGNLPAARMTAPLDPLGKGRRSVWQGPHGLVVAAERSDRASGHAGGEWRGWFSGEAPGNRPLPWDRLIRALTECDDAILAALNGWFAILLVHEPSGRFWAVSDRRAQQPLFCHVSGEAVHVATAAAAFCRLPAAPAFDPGWLYETIYFNYPVLDRTFLDGVSRVPPATVLTWQPGQRALTARQWSRPFARPTTQARGQEAAALERQTFLTAAADHFEADARTAVALTAGFDARAVLASAPRRSDDLLAYTYGLPGSGDMLGAAKVAAGLKVRHLAIALDEGFTARLPDLMVDAVRCSDGLERVIRAELLAVYPTLAAQGRTLAVGGVSGDHLFRDHLRGTGNVPALISPAMMGYIHGRGDGLDGREFSRLFGHNDEAFRAHIAACLDKLQMRHGDVRRPEGYQRFLVYENAPKYFGGEAALAANHLRWRSLYWDPRLVELSFVSERGTLGLSERLPGKDRFVEAAAQAGVIVAGPHYGGGRVKGVRASTWARGNRPLFRLEKAAVRATQYAANGLRRPRVSGLTRWPAWLAGPARPLAEDLLGPASRLRSLLDERFLDTFEPAADVRLAGRLLTAELVLRLCADRWPLASDERARP